jgi:hypothetical protein
MVEVFSQFDLETMAGYFLFACFLFEIFLIRACGDSVPPRRAKEIWFKVTVLRPKASQKKCKFSFSYRTGRTKVHRSPPVGVGAFIGL